MNDDSVYAVETLRTWYERIAAELHEHSAVAVFEAWDGMAEVTIQAPEHSINICARDHRSCLDIVILDRQTAELKFPATGPCGDRADFSRHLSLLWFWFLRGYSNAA
ncbi:MAG: hypothetical protein PVH89_11905 [Gammaproteobacteria bacterium]|jgi:hypothetical protein